MVGRPVGVPRTRRRTGGREGDGRVVWPGDGYPRGKQFLLIQRSHPHGGVSLVDPLLDLSSPRSVPFLPFLSRSHVVLSPSLFLFLFLVARANLASANKCFSTCHSTVIHRILLFTPSRYIAKTTLKFVDRFNLYLVITL